LFIYSGYQPEDEDAYKHCNVDTVGKCIMGFVYVASDASSVATCWLVYTNLVILYKPTKKKYKQFSIQFLLTINKNG